MSKNLIIEFDKKSYSKLYELKQRLNFVREKNK